MPFRDSRILIVRLIKDVLALLLGSEVRLLRCASFSRTRTRAPNARPRFRHEVMNRLMHPANIAKFHAGLILESALKDGWEPPDKYSPLKRARIKERMRKLAEKLITGKGR